jgi:hypothetical protein
MYSSSHCTGRMRKWFSQHHVLNWWFIGSEPHNSKVVQCSQSELHSFPPLKHSYQEVLHAFQLSCKAQSYSATGMQHTSSSTTKQCCGPDACKLVWCGYCWGCFLGATEVLLWRKSIVLACLQRSLLSLVNQFAGEGLRMLYGFWILI